MADVAGKWNCVVKSPLGEQQSVLTVNSDGSGGWTGTNEGAQGALECKDGKVDGDAISWKMDMTVPMPMTLDCKATIDGDILNGSVTAGPFGTFPMAGTRA
ncbi:MAG: hypothetical protein H0X36_06035 [Sphingomonadaceae bacterium]|nr:hypothetical protein [Sphingomonadaceae bacterium]